MKRTETSKSEEYDTKNTQRIITLLDRTPKGLTITEMSSLLNLNRHTVTKIIERLLIEKRVDYDEKGPAKVFYSSGSGRFIGRIDQGKFDKLWIDLFKPGYEGEEEFIRINQTKHDNLSRSSSKFRSVGAVSIKKSKLNELIKILKSVE
ncbi:MAG: hypothetical protein QXY45_04575 [Candidatus Aenigmatarchaeota archaeon]